MMLAVKLRSGHCRRFVERVGNVVAVDVEELDRGPTIRSGKTDEEDKGVVLYIGALTHEVIR